MGRTEERRKSERRVLGWSLGAAAVVHVLVFVAGPTFEAEPLTGADVELDTTGILAGANATARISFGPPTIRVMGEPGWTAPADRVLAAVRDVRLDVGCRSLAATGRTPVFGRVRLHVKESGRVDVHGLAVSTGDACADQVLRDVAGDLWYHWLPDARFAAPVDLEQPVELTQVTLSAF